MGRHAEVVEIDEIEEKRELIIDRIGDNLLKEPIRVEVSFEKYDDKDDFWVVSNKELGVVGVDDTIEKARKVFEEDLCEYYRFYKGIPDNELTERTQRIKEGLIQIFESETLLQVRQRKKIFDSQKKEKRRKGSGGKGGKLLDFDTL